MCRVLVGGSGIHFGPSALNILPPSTSPGCFFEWSLVAAQKFISLCLSLASWKVVMGKVRFINNSTNLFGTLWDPCGEALNQVILVLIFLTLLLILSRWESLYPIEVRNRSIPIRTSVLRVLLLLAAGLQPRREYQAKARMRTLSVAGIFITDTYSEYSCWWEW